MMGDVLENISRYNPGITYADFVSLLDALKTERDRVYGTTIISEYNWMSDDEFFGRGRSE